MTIEYRRAGLGDLELLVQVRALVLKAANDLPEGTDMAPVEGPSREYYARALAEGSHVAYLAWAGDELAGAGGICFYRVMPTWHEPDGRRGYIMNLYTAPAFRRRGVARGMLERLTAEARARGVKQLSLEATPMGRPLYEAFGFAPLADEMGLTL